MHIRVQAKDFTPIVTDFSSKKIMYNLAVRDGYLHIQVLEDYTACTEIPCEILDGEVLSGDWSVWFDKVMTVLGGKTPIEIVFGEKAVEIRQGTFYVILNREYEAARTFPDFYTVEMKKLHTGSLKGAVHGMVRCLPMPKEIGISAPDPIFSNGRVVLDYSQAAYVDEVQFPECCVAFSILRVVAFKLDTTVDFTYFPQNNVMYFGSEKYSFWVPTMNYNVNTITINGIMGKLQGVQEITRTNIVSWQERLDIVASAYPKRKMVLTICRGGILILVNTNNSRVVVGNGDSEQYICSLEITSAQLSAIVKLFGPEEEIIIGKGSNCICLRANSKNMLIAGLLY